MNLKNKFKIEPPRLQMTPMIDIFTVILIFFIVSFSVDNTNIELDKNTQLPVLKLDKQELQGIHVQVLAESFRINGKEMDENIESWANELKKNSTAASQGILIEADADIPYQRIDKAISKLGQSGVNDIQFVVEVKGDEYESL